MSTTTLAQDLNYNIDSESISHWTSYGRHEEAGGMISGSGCIVSIVLDDSSINDFSAIRFLIVSKPSQNFDHLVRPILYRITDCDDPSGWKRATNSSRPQTHYRTRLHRLRAASHGTTVTLAPPVFDLPIFTVVFELIDTGEMHFMHDLQLASLVPYSHLTLNQSPLRVAYDRVHRVSPGNPSLLVFLDSNICFERLPEELCDSHLPSAIPVHSIRVLPIFGRQRSFFPLHPAIIRHAVDLAIGNGPRGWRRALLAYGLVSKSWAHVLDLFFERFDGSIEFPKVDVLDVARALDRRPERGALIRTLNFANYRGRSLGDQKTVGPFYSGLDGWHAFLKILQFATSARSIYLPTSVPKIFTSPLVRGLSDLRDIRSCFLLLSALTMADIQSFIARCEDLATLTVTHWAGEGDVE
ncbi:hypothetical protein FPV67DRAFT_1481595 [Lyophyllum atratum]|nr:hypothetical protein FPV67DRAFT_1481595 [Lyophyllum atratum]